MTEEQVWIEIGRRIRIMRKWRGMTQETVADRMRITRASIANIERGRQKCPVWSLLKLSALFNVPAHIWLLTPDDWAAWCRVQNVTQKRVIVRDKPFTRTYKAVERVVEQVAAE